MISFMKLSQKYSKRATEQEKTRKYKFLKQPGSSAKEKWLFANECIKRCIRTKNGSFHAFNMPTG